MLNVLRPQTKIQKSTKQKIHRKLNTMCMQKRYKARQCLKAVAELNNVHMNKAKNLTKCKIHRKQKY